MVMETRSTHGPPHLGLELRRHRPREVQEHRAQPRRKVHDHLRARSRRRRGPGWARSWRRCARGEPGPGADVGGASPVLAQMCAGQDRLQPLERARQRLLRLRLRRREQPAAAAAAYASTRRRGRGAAEQPRVAGAADDQPVPSL